MSDRDTPPPSIQTAAAAEQLAAHFSDVMDGLLRLLDEETELVRAGKISELIRLERTKAEMARLYMADAVSVKANRATLAKLAPAAFKSLREKHDEFHALLKINLAVLATAHAVSEGIIRGVADRMARKATPTTYGMSGRANAPSARQAQPFTVARSL
jgi:hypothetical protein